jgi:hypothetical protein
MGTRKQTFEQKAADLREWNEWVQMQKLVAACRKQWPCSVHGSRPCRCIGSVKIQLRPNDFWRQRCATPEDRLKLEAEIVAYCTSQHAQQQDQPQESSGGSESCS